MLASLPSAAPGRRQELRGRKAELSPCPSAELGNPIPSSPALGEEGDEDLGAEAGSSRQGPLLTPTECPAPIPTTAKQKNARNTQISPPLPPLPHHPPGKASASELCTSQDPSSRSSRPSLSLPGCHPELGKQDSGSASRGARPAPGKAQPPPPQAGLAAWVFFACYSKVHVTRRGVSNGSGGGLSSSFFFFF